MQQAKPVQKFRITLSRLLKQTGALVDSVAHWQGTPSVNAADAVEHLGNALRELAVADQRGTQIDPTWIPNKRPSIRGYARLAAGDFCVIAERHQKRSPETLHGQTLIVVTPGPRIIVVESGGIKYGLEARTLKPAPRPKT